MCNTRLVRMVLRLGDAADRCSVRADSRVIHCTRNCSLTRHLLHNICNVEFVMGRRKGGGRGKTILGLVTFYLWYFTTTCAVSVRRAQGIAAAFAVLGCP